MALSKVNVYNMALSAIGIRGRIQLPTEVSPEAEQCEVWYDSVVDLVLRSAPWSVTRAQARLPLLAERDFNSPWVPGQPDAGWRFMYAWPSDCLWPRNLAGFGIFETGVSNTDVRTILTNTEQALLTYSRRQTRVDLWDADLLHAVAFTLGAHIAFKLTGKPARVQQAAQQAYEKIINARITDKNADQFQPESTAPWLVARGYENPGPDSRFIYQPAPFIIPGAVLNDV